MTVLMDTAEFQTRVGALLQREGTVLTTEQLAHLAERYAQCPGKEQWDIREYRGALTPLGAREYRVLRGSRIQDVYTSAERDRAAAVRSALNELETQEGMLPG